MERLVSAVYLDEVETVREMLNQGISPNFKTPPTDQTLLGLAVSRGSYEMIELLKERGVGL